MKAPVWVVVTQQHQLICKRCQATHQIRLPCPIWEYVAISEGFGKEHQECEVEADATG